MNHPYWGKGFFEFFIVLAKRIFQQIPTDHLASDEIQILALISLSIAIVPIGTLLTLRKMTMMANALSHTTLPGIVLSYILFSKSCHFEMNGIMLLFAAALAAMATTIFIDFMEKFLHVQKDAAIGLVFTTLFAIGILLVTIFIRDSHMGVEIITGNLDALHVEDLQLTGLTCVMNILCIFPFLPSWIITTFDRHFASSVGAPSRLFHYVLMFLTALTMISAFRAIGILLVLSFLIGPTLIARQWTHKFLPLIFLSMLITITLSIIGVALSRHILSIYHISLSTGGLIVNLISLTYLLSTLLTFRSTRGLIKVSS